MVQDSIIIGILSIPVGFFVAALIKGKLPAIGGGGYRNRFLFGDRSANPILLVGSRARIVSLLFGGVFTLIVFVIYTQNQNITDQYLNSVLSSIIGMIVGIAWYRYALGYASGKNR